jgi:hypothetical protein
MAAVSTNEVTCLETGFGWIIINGTRYEHDVIIIGGTVSKRKKKLSKARKDEYGHTPLSARELEFLSDEKPGVVYIGTGQYGDLPVTPDALEVLQGYPAVIKPTPEILPLIERETKKYAAILHITC